MTYTVTTTSNSAVLGCGSVLTPEAVRLAEIRQRLGDDLFAKVYPNAPRWEP